MGGKRWTSEEDALLVRLWPTHTDVECARFVHELSGRDVTFGSINSRAHRLGLEKRDGHVRWKDHPKYDEFLRSYIPGHEEREIISAFDERFGIRLTASQVGNRKNALGVYSGTHGGSFKPGHTPANKGKKWRDFMPPESQERCRATCFKSGQLPHNTREIGAERVTKDGYIEVHVAQYRKDRPNDQWVAKQRVIWEKTHGRPVPEGCMVVFADGDKRNFDPDNLVLETMEQHGVICAKGLAYADAETHGTAVALADLSMAAMERRKETKR